jgi:4-hydroxybenzoate polyprenyltransferase
MASGSHIVEGLVDQNADHTQPMKKNLPLAPSDLKSWQGFVAVPLFVAGGLVGRFLSFTSLVATMLLHLIVTLAYCFKLEFVVPADAISLSFLYPLRLVIGAVLAGLALSQRFIVVLMFLIVSV